MALKISARGCTTLGLLCLLSSNDTTAFAVRTDVFGETVGMLLDFEVAYGVGWRVQDRDTDLIGPGNGGTRSNGNANLDDGNLNYNRGDPISNMVRGTGELTLKWRNFGAFARAHAFYDFENEDQPRARTRLSSEALDQIGSDVELLDAYFVARFNPSGMPLNLRLGQQVVSWGESRFFPLDSVNVANPVNLPLFQQATGSARDLYLPVGTLWGALQLRPEIAIEGYYQYEWQPSVLPALGTYFSTTDAVSPGAEFAQSSVFGDQGTNVDEFFGLPPGTVGFVPDWFQVPRASDDKPDSSGQFGISLRVLAPSLNDTSFHLMYANYHSKLPSFSVTMPSTQAYLAYSEQAIAARSAELESLGVDPETASRAGNAIQFNQFLNDTRYQGGYHEDIQMVGFSFNTTSLRTGTALFGETGYHFDVPMPVVINQLMAQGLPGSVPEDPFPPVDLAQISPAEIASDYAGKEINFAREYDKNFVSLGATQLFGPQLGATQSTLTAEVGWLHIVDFPSQQELLIQGPGLSATQLTPKSVFADANSWGYRIAGNLMYTNVLGALTLTPRVIFSHDVEGNSPAGVGSFREGGQTLTVGLQARYIQSFHADISYTQFQGAGEYNLRNDRDYIRFNIRYFF